MKAQTVLLKLLIKTFYIYVLKKETIFCLKYRYTVQLIPIVGFFLYVLGSNYSNISFERQLRINFEWMFCTPASCINLHTNFHQFVDQSFNKDNVLILLLLNKENLTNYLINEFSMACYALLMLCICMQRYIVQHHYSIFSNQKYSL